MSTDYESDKRFTNWSQNVDITPARTYRPTTVDDVVAIVREGQRTGRRVRAVGAGWSFGDVVATNDFLVDTRGLAGVLALSQGSAVWSGAARWLPFNASVPETSPVLVEALRSEVLASSRRLVHVRAGTTIRTLLAVLEAPSLGTPSRPAWTLPTMGGASGQTLAGAIGTGTHGGHFDLPPIADMVQAMLLVGPDGRRHWIERGGAGAITDPTKTAAALALEAGCLHQDDAWFRAALVSLGNLGIVTDYILEVRGQYGISEVVDVTTWKDLAPLLASGEIFTTTRYSARDPSKKWLGAHPNKPDRRGIGVGIFINPYRISDDYEGDRNPDRRVMLVTHAASETFEAAHSGPGGTCIFDQMHLIHGFERAKKLFRCRLIVDRIIDTLRSGNGTGGAYRMASSVLDTSSDSQPPILGMEIAISTAGGQHVRFVDRLLQILDEMLADYWRRGVRAKFAGGINLRFTRPTTAYLGMQSPVSGAPDERFCHVEIIVMREQSMTGRPLDADYTLNDMENYTEAFTDAFERATDEFGARLHWGQLSRTRRHDPDRYPSFGHWLQIKRELTNNGALQTFENEFSGRHLRPQYDVALRAHNGQYVVAEGGGGRELRADRPGVREWETFKLIELGGSRVALRANDGSYVAAEGGGGGPLVANRRDIRAWETFERIDLGENRIALRASNGQFVVAEDGGGGPVLANRDLRQAWETFTLHRVGDAAISAAILPGLVAAIRNLPAG
jgi:hypothetical protein